MKIVVIGGSGLIGKKLSLSSAGGATRPCRPLPRRALTRSPAKGWARRSAAQSSSM